LKLIAENCVMKTTL